jgi:lysophospholipase L1-like esterase
MKEIILFQGDSITDCGRSRENDGSMGSGYATMVAAELGAANPYRYQFYNRGVAGDRIVDLYARIRKDMINLKPDCMSILVGVNDVAHEYKHRNGVDAAKFKMICGLIIEELKRELPALKIMLLEPFILPGSITEDTQDHPQRWAYYRDEVALRAMAAKEIADKYGLPFVPLQDAFTAANADAPEQSYWTFDGVHPTPAGHALIKRAWLDAFKSL